jgi:hypothetical protein
MTYKGRLPHGEVWQTGFWLRGGAPLDNAAATTAAQLEFDSEGTSTPSSLWNVLKAFLDPSVTLDNVTVYSYPAGGTDAAAIGVSTGAAHVGTTASGIGPNQVAMCVSLLTPAAGRSQRGRMFLPIGLAAISGGTGFFTTTAITNISTALATKFVDFQASSPPWIASVVSQLHTSSLPISSVSIDSRPDVQRRRANKISDATRVAHAVPAP